MPKSGHPTTGRYALNAVGITFCCCVAVIILWFEIAIAEKMLIHYRASIVRDTVAAMKEANVR